MLTAKYEIKRKCGECGPMFLAKTIGEIAEKSAIAESTVYSHIRKYSIPILQIGSVIDIIVCGF